MATLGIDIGGTRIKAVALEKPDKITERYEGPSDAKEGPEMVRRALGLAIQYFKGKKVKVERVGIGCAGSVSSTGVVRNSPNFAAWKDIPLREWIEKDSRAPTTVENDANCAVFCEWKIGAAAGARNVVLLTLGTGIGGGLILDGRLFRGSTGTAGELGHLSIRSDGKPCPCGNRGCFERYCSASALRDRAGREISARDIFMQSSQSPYREMIEDFISDFQIGLTSIANVFDPDVILIGGGVAKGVANYFPRLEQWLKDHAFPAVAAHVRLAVAKHGNMSGALGAALLAAE